MSERIADSDNSWAKHDKAQRWVSDLVIDLKKQMLGHEPRQAVTMERLDEWHKVHHPDLNKCRTGGLRK